MDAVNQGGISGIAGVIYPIDALDEYSLQTTGNSESGRSPGGNLNVTTKSGTNQFHGDAYYYNRNEALAVISPFLPPDRRSSRCATRTMALRSAGPSGTTTPSSSSSTRSRSSSSEKPIPSPSRRRPTRALALGGADQIRRRAQPGLAEHPQHAVGSERHRQPSRYTGQLLQQRAAERLQPQHRGPSRPELQRQEPPFGHLVLRPGLRRCSILRVCLLLPAGVLPDRSLAHPELQRGLELQHPPQPEQPACRRRQLLYAGLCRCGAQPESPYAGRPQHGRYSGRRSADRHQRLRLDRRHADLGPQRHLRPDCGYALLDGRQTPVALRS